MINVARCICEKWGGVCYLVRALIERIFADSPVFLPLHEPTSPKSSWTRKEKPHVNQLPKVCNQI